MRWEGGGDASLFMGPGSWAARHRRLVAEADSTSVQCPTGLRARGRRQV